METPGPGGVTAPGEEATGAADVAARERAVKLGALLMPSHAPERTIADGQSWDLEEIERLDGLGFAEAWIGEHFTAAWEPCPAPDLLIAQT